MNLHSSCILHDMSRFGKGFAIFFPAFLGNYVYLRRQTALKGACKAWSTQFHAPFGPPAGYTIRASTPARLAPSISVSSLSPSMAVSAAVTPACSMARRKPVVRGFCAWPT